MIDYTKHFSTSSLQKTLDNPILKDWVSEIRTDDVNRKFGMVLENVLKSWTTESSETAIRELKLFLPYINKLKVVYPEKFNLDTSKYKTVFRGTNLDMDKLKQFISISDKTKWKKISLQGKSFMIYFDKQFTYTPHKYMQSWTTNINRSVEFGECILLAKSNKVDFFMSPEYLDSISEQPDKEYETIHVGKNLKVFLGIESEWFNGIVNNLK